MNISNVLGEQGDHEKCLFHLQNALEIYERALGPSHVSVARTIGNIANVNMAQGDLENALLRNQEALEIFLKTLGPSQVRMCQLLM